MKRRWIRTAGLIAFTVVAQQCAQVEGTASEDAQVATVPGTGAAVVTRIVNVETVQIVPTDFIDFIRITGEAEALHDILISAEEGGIVESFPVAKGARVRRGQILLRIDADVLSAQVDEARAASELSDEQFARQQRLWEQESIGTEIAFLTARYTAQMARARLATLEARLNKSIIRSPVAGVFDDQYVDPGEIVIPGARVARVVSIDRLKVIGGVPERYAPFVRPGRAAVVSFDILPGREFPGTISYVSSSVEDQTRTFGIEIVIDNPDGIIKPQMVANVRLVREEIEDAIVIAQDFIIRSEDGNHVYVVDTSSDQPVAQTRAVTLGATFGGTVVVLDGLEIGEIIVARGAQLVDNGSRLALVERQGESND